MTPAKHPQATAATLSLPGADEVHLWRVDLDREAADLDVLDADESARAARFVSPLHRRRFAVSRMALRTTLSRYLRLAPGDVRFGYGPHGRPSVPDAPFDFNLSHTENVWLLAVAAGPVGVDVERPSREADLEGLARQVMTAAELAAFRRLSAAAAEVAFYDLWTRKEALMKLLGTGFSQDARSLDVGWGDRSIWREGDLQVTLRPIHVDADLSASLASRRPLNTSTWMT